MLYGMGDTKPRRGYGTRVGEQFVMSAIFFKTLRDKTDLN